MRHFSSWKQTFLRSFAGRRPANRMGPHVGSRIVLGALRVYKILISPMFTGSCRYLPSCSDYMAGAIVEHGTIRGMFLGLGRLSRCHPWGGSGEDPVPPAVHGRP